MAHQDRQTSTNLRIPNELRERLDRMAAKLPITRHRLMLLAIERGLAQIERNPELILAPPFDLENVHATRTHGMDHTKTVKRVRRAKGVTR